MVAFQPISLTALSTTSLPTRRDWISVVNTLRGQVEKLKAVNDAVVKEIDVFTAGKAVAMSRRDLATVSICKTYLEHLRAASALCSQYIAEGSLLPAPVVLAPAVEPAPAPVAPTPTPTPTPTAIETSTVTVTSDGVLIPGPDATVVTTPTEGESVDNRDTITFHPAKSSMFPWLLAIGAGYVGYRFLKGKK
jgi:hypothetical protein